MVLVPQGLLDSAARNAAAVAIQRGAESLTYGQLVAQAAALSRCLTEAGLRQGDRVALLFDSGPDYAMSCYGTWFAGGAVLGLNAAARAQELARTVAHADCRFVLMDGAHAEAAAMAALLPPDVRIIARSPGRVPAATDLAALIADAGAVGPVDVRLDPGSLASLIYTSGTTGRPKAVMLSHANLAANAAGIIDYLQLDARDSIVCVLPFHYSYGASVLHTHLLAGARIIVERNLVFPHRVVETLSKERATGFAGVPSTFALLTARVALQDYDLASLRYVTQAGGGMSMALAERVRAGFPHSRLFVMYGQTEATARLTWLPPERLDEKRGSVGRPLRDVAIQIRDEQGGQLAPMESGEVWVKGPNVMLGYWKDPEATAATLVDGWLRTGDHGHLDREGYLYLDGRRSDIIKVGAHRVHPLDVEHVIEELPGVAEVAVVPEEDPVLGQTIKACVVRRDAALSADAVKAHCRARLASYKIPKTVEFVPGLPRTESGKLRRHLINKSGPLPAAG